MCSYASQKNPVNACLLLLSRRMSRFVERNFQKTENQTRQGSLLEFVKVDSFCSICSEFKIADKINRVTEFIQKAFHAYFGVQLGDQDKPWAPHVVCKTCIEHLRQRTQGSQKALKFGILMIWSEPKNNTDDC